MVAPSVLVREGTRKKRHNYSGDTLKSSIERLRLKLIKDVISMSHFPIERNSSPLVKSLVSKTKKRECYVLTLEKSNWSYLYSRDLFLNLNLDVGVIGQVVADS